MNNIKNKILIYLCAAIFGIAGIYLTFFSANTNKYDSQVKAYRIYPNESYDSDGATIYYPTYYYIVNGQEYECKVTSGSGIYPKENKNTVYYDSTNPAKCKTEYEKSTGRLGGIICFIATAVIVYFFIIKKPSNNEENYTYDIENSSQIDPEKAEKMIGVIEKVQLIYKRVILGIVIAILLVFILLDTALFKQTIKSRNYIETTATYVEKKETSYSEISDDYIYTFVDKEGKEQEVIKSYPKDGSITPKESISVKYNENNPQDYYEEGSTLDKSGMIWYIVKLVALVLLIALFFNKKLLSKIGLSLSNRN